MRNCHLDDRTAKDIDSKVHRIHRDLGYSGGAVRLNEVLDLLRLDLAYYRVDDPTILQEVAHKLRVGAKQVLERPTLLLDAVRKFDLKALFLPDRKRILLDESIPELKRRWNAGHEVSHDIIDWHRDYMLGDTHLTLSPTCHERIEHEANYCAGRLLFPSAHFSEQLGSSPLSLKSVSAIAKSFGNTITSTLWRCVENSGTPSVGVIGDHPRRRTGMPIVDHLICSKEFAARFSRFADGDAEGLILGYCGYQRGGPLGQSEVEIVDDSGSRHVFFFETFCLKHLTLTLGTYVRPAIATIAVPTMLGGKRPKLPQA